MPASREAPAIEAGRAQAEPSERVRALPAEEEEDEEGDGTVSEKLVASTKRAHGLVEVSSLPLPVYIRLVVVDVVW